jgi:hypothetical protein
MVPFLLHFGGIGGDVLHPQIATDLNTSCVPFLFGKVVEMFSTHVKWNGELVESPHQ